jgi:hypothetical protein
MATRRLGTPPVYSIASSATPSVNADLYDMLVVTALAAAITSLTVTGSPADGDRLLVRIKDNGTPRGLAFGTGFIASGSVALPTTTIANKTHTFGFIRDAALSKWVIMASDPLGY